MQTGVATEHLVEYEKGAAVHMDVEEVEEVLDVVLEVVLDVVLDVVEEGVVAEQVGVTVFVPAAA